MKKFAQKYEFVCRIIMTIITSHVAFIAHTLLGVVVIGFFPSVSALFATYRTWILDVDDRHWTMKQTWLTFHEAWKSDIRGANLYGYPLAFLLGVWIWEYYLTNWNDLGAIGYAISGVLIVLIVFHFVFLLFLGMLRAHFQQKAGWLISRSLQMVIARPISTVLIVALFLLIVWLDWLWPGLFMAFGISPLIFAVVAVTYSFSRLPGMDIHVLEKHKRHANSKSV